MTTLASETWRDIPSLPGVRASSEGRLMVVPFVSPVSGRTYGGTPVVGSWDEDRFTWHFRDKTYKVARLVCEAFHGPAKPGQVCMHRDENSRNNRPSNLAWGTQKENLNAPEFVSRCRAWMKENNPRKRRA